MARLTDLQAGTLGRVRDWGDDGLPLDCPYTGRVVAALVRLEMVRVEPTGRGGPRFAFLTDQGRAWLHAEAVRQATPEPEPVEPEPSRQLDLLGGAS